MTITHGIQALQAGCRDALTGFVPEILLTFDTAEQADHFKRRFISEWAVFHPGEEPIDLAIVMFTIDGRPVRIAVKS